MDALLAADDGARRRLLASLAEALRAVHGWTPPLPRPKDWLDETLAMVRHRVERGEVAGPIERRGWSGPVEPAEVPAFLEAGRHEIKPQVVFCHGDFYLPNALVREGRVVGVIDWSRGRYADYRTDQIQTVRSIRFNLKDEALVEAFLRAYGYEGDAGSLGWFGALEVVLP